MKEKSAAAAEAREVRISSLVLPTLLASLPFALSSWPWAALVDKKL